MTLSNTFNKHSAEWRELRDLLKAERASLVEKLVRSDCSETRGKIKMLDDILALDAQEDVQAPPDAVY